MGLIGFMGFIGLIGFIGCIGFRLPPTGLVTIVSRSSPASAACTSSRRGCCGFGCDTTSTEPVPEP